MNISARVVADSVCAESHKRITTYELEYHRFIHSEFMTHRMISKNAASSRAIPVASVIDNIKNNTATPTYWGKNQPGMSAQEELSEQVRISGNNLSRVEAWNAARDCAIEHSKAFNEAGYHKQIVNRITEPYQLIKVVATATEWQNLFWLRDHSDAQPEFRVLAQTMKAALDNSVPTILKPGEWHMPYVNNGVWKSSDAITLEEALMISSSCCAQVSYRKSDDSLEKAKSVYARLIESSPVHASPTEHQATPIGKDHLDPRSINAKWKDGITHVTRLGIFGSGNLCGWIQHRQLIPNNSLSG